MTIARRLIGLGIVLTALCSGCTRRLAVELVDASTRRPLAGVSTRLHSYNFDYVLGQTDRHAELPATGPDGLVPAPALSTRLMHSFFFQKDGYHDAGAAYSAGDDLLVWDSPVPKPGTVPEASLRVRGEVVVIPMYRRSAPESK